MRDGREQGRMSHLGHRLARGYCVGFQRSYHRSLCPMLRRGSQRFSCRPVASGMSASKLTIDTQGTDLLVVFLRRNEVRGNLNCLYARLREGSSRLCSVGVAGVYVERNAPGGGGGTNSSVEYSVALRSLRLRYLGGVTPEACRAQGAGGARDVERGLADGGSECAEEHGKDVIRAGESERPDVCPR